VELEAQSLDRKKKRKEKLENLWKIFKKLYENGDL
jgi:hypothetical protein